MGTSSNIYSDRKESTREHDGTGAWTPLPNGSLVEKTGSVSGEDAHPDGTRGRILLQVGPMQRKADVPEKFWGMYGYFVAWETHPALPVFVVGMRVRPIQGDASTLLRTMTAKG